MQQTLQYIKAAFVAVAATDIAALVTESKWLLLAVMVCVTADYHYAKGECGKRLAVAVEKGDTEAMKEHGWRKSRAWRRTVNKLVDYLLWVTVGMILGAALLTPFGLPRIWGGAAATAIACACETASLAGHFLYLRGVEVDGGGVRSAITRFVVALARRKNPDIGGALGDALGKGRTPDGGGTDERGNT